MNKLEQMTSPGYMMDAIRKGAAFLDDAEPGWRDRLSPAELDLSDCDACVLGQVFGEYGNAMDRLELWSKGVEHGFSTREKDYPQLTSLWLGYIKGEWS